MRADCNLQAVRTTLDALHSSCSYHEAIQTGKNTRDKKEVACALCTRTSYLITSNVSQAGQQVSIDKRRVRTYAFAGYERKETKRNPHLKHIAIPSII